MMKERNRAYRRFQRNRVIQKRRKLVAELYGQDKSFEHFPFDGFLDKGKIHCSCDMCQQKVKTNGWKHSDRKQLLRMYDVNPNEIYS